MSNLNFVMAGVGYFISSNPEDPDESFSAGEKAAQNAVEFIKRKYRLTRLDPADFTLTMVFSSTDYELEQMLKGVRSITDNCPLIGCTTAGEITSQGAHDNSVSVFILSSELMVAATGVEKDVPGDAESAGRTAASNAMKELKTLIDTRSDSILMLAYASDPIRMIGFYPYSIILLPPGMSTSGGLFYPRDDNVIDGLRKEIHDYAPIIGGSSGDGGEVQMSYQFCNNKVYGQSVVCAILVNFLKTGFSTAHPFVPTQTAYTNNIINPPHLGQLVRWVFR